MFLHEINLIVRLLNYLKNYIESLICLIVDHETFQ